MIRYETLVSKTDAVFKGNTDFHSWIGTLFKDCVIIKHLLLFYILPKVKHDTIRKIQKY